MVLNRGTEAQISIRRFDSITDRMQQLLGGRHEVL